MVCALVAFIAAAAGRVDAADSLPAPCSAANVLSARVDYHFSGPQLGSVATSCLLPLYDLAGNADPSSAVVLSFTKAGLAVQFNFSQTHLRTDRSVFRNDNLAITVVRTQSGNKKPFVATADANGNCKSASAAVRFLTVHDQCATDVARKGSAGSFTWSGSVAVGYAVLDSVLSGDGAFAVEVRRTILTPEPARPSLSQPSFRNSDPAPAAFITIDRRVADMAPDRYVSAGADIGKPVDVPPHRLVTNVVVPLDASNLATATFADDAGRILSIRSKAVKSIPESAEAKSFACRSCGSFLTTNKQPFDLALTSAATLGVDLSSLGVDTTPFDLDAVSFPIDAGYKFVHTGDATFAAAAFSGTTRSSGVAHDGVVRYRNAFAWKNKSKLQIGVFHAFANRSRPGTAPAGVYPALDPFAARTTNTQLSAAFSRSEAVTLPNVPAVSTGAATTLAALVRYGTQYAGSSQTFDAAVSTLRDPAVFNTKSKFEDKRHVGFALGYRAVGPAYGPLDADFDLHTGLRGFYGLVELTAPVCKPPANCHLRTRQLDAKVAGYRFSDGAQPRDTSLSASVTYPFVDTLSLDASYAAGALTVSQAGRANDILVSDAHGGNQYLPNGQYSAGLTYTANTGSTAFFRLAAGYTVAHAQGCNPKLVKATPCYGYRSPSATGSIYWRPFRKFSDFFASGSIQNSTNQPFATGASALAQLSPDGSFATTASHIVRTAAVGAHLFSFKPGGCSTLLLTTSNRGGNIDHFASSPPQPGYTNTASLELVPAGGWPTVLTAYSRVGNLDGGKPPVSLFVVRMQYGILPNAFAAATTRSCSGK